MPVPAAADLAQRHQPKCDLSVRKHSLGRETDGFTLQYCKKP